jgi:hypothetical protein
MKSFIFAVILFSLLLAFISYNYIYVNKTVDRLCCLVDDLPDTDSPTLSESLEKLKSDWGSAKTFIELSSNDSIIEKIDDLITSLFCYAQHEDSTQFEHTRALLKNHLKNLAAFESLALGDIL